MRWRVMAGETFGKGSEEYILFKDFYALCQKLWRVEENELYWEEVIKEVDRFAERYKTCSLPTQAFVKGLWKALVDKLETEHRNKLSIYAKKKGWDKIK